MSIAVSNELAAADLYGEWALENPEGGTPLPWERLTNRERSAWLRVVHYIADNGLNLKREKCSICGTLLVCEQCEELLCPLCGKRKPLLCTECFVEEGLKPIPVFTRRTICIGEMK